MVSGIRFFPCSGAMGLFGNVGEKSITQVYTERAALPVDPTIPLLEIFNFEISATASPNRVGFFGSNGAPSSPVIVGQYQDTTFRTNFVGADLGEMINVKYTGASTADVSGTLGTGPMFGSNIALSSIPNTSGSLLARFTEPNATAVITQQATFAAINLDAGSGAPNVSDLATGVTVQAAQLADTEDFAGQSSWSEISSGGSALSLDAQAAEANVHDFHLIISATPSAAGRKTNFAYYLQLEFL